MHGFRAVPTKPSFGESGASGIFFYCDLAVAPDGQSVYIAAGDQLWRVSL